MTSPKPTFRAFVAIELPQEVRAVLARLQADLRHREPRAVRWVDAGGIHLTLKFLGETPEERVEAIGAALKQVADRHHPLRLRLAELGAFPSLNAPARVLWIGLEGEVERLLALQREIEAALRPLGFPREERPFSPHLTLGRVQQGRRVRARDLYRGLNLPRSSEGAFLATGVSLMESTLTPQGARYRQRLFVPLTQPLSSEGPSLYTPLDR